MFKITEASEPVKKFIYDHRANDLTLVLTYGMFKKDASTNLSVNEFTQCIYFLESDGLISITPKRYHQEQGTDYEFDIKIRSGLIREVESRSN